MKYLLILATCLLAGCADLNTTAFRLEKAYADQATGAVHGFNEYYAATTNGASTKQLDELNKTRDLIYEAARKSAAVLAVTEASRLAYSTNTTPTAKVVLQQNLSALGANSGNVTNAVATAFAPFSTLNPK